jgi:uncharacterized protein YoxC
MIIEISVGIIAVAFLGLVIFLIKVLLTANSTLRQSRLTMMHVQKEVQDLSEESQKLLKTVNGLTSDIKEKSASLNFLFRPMTNLSKESRHKAKHHEEEHDTVIDIVDWVSSGIFLYKKLIKR